MFPVVSFIPAKAILEAFATGKESSTNIFTGSPWIYIVASKFPSFIGVLYIILVIFFGFSDKADNVDKK